MDHPVVLFVDVAHGCGHATFGHDRVGLTEEGLGDDADLQSALLGLNGGTQTGATGADDEYVVLVVFSWRIG